MVRYQQTPANIVRFGHIVVFLREEMKKRDWGPVDLSRALGLKDKNTAVYPWLRGSGAPSPEMRAKLVALFEVPEETFMAREPEGDAVTRIKATIAKAMAPPPKPQDVLTFNVTSDGQARLRLDATLPLAVAAPLLRMLLDAGLVFGQDEPASG